MVRNAGGGPSSGWVPRPSVVGTIQQLFVGLTTHTNVTALTVLLGPLPGSGVVLGSRATTSWWATAPRRGRVMVPLRCGPTRVPTGSPLQAAAVAPLKQ